MLEGQTDMSSRIRVCRNQESGITRCLVQLYARIRHKQITREEKPPQNATIAKLCHPHLALAHQTKGQR